MPDGDEGMFEEAILAAIRARFASRPPPQIVREPTGLSALGGDWRPDLVMRMGDVVLVVEVANRLSLDDVARASMYDLLVQREELMPGPVEHVLMAKVVPTEVREMARRVGVTVVRLPGDLQLTGSSPGREFRVSKLSNDKSWRVVACLLRKGPASVRGISLEAGVSYGWAHATVSRLLQMGVAARTVGGVAVTDVERLLNGLAWERPLKGLQTADVKLAGEEVIGTGRTLGGYLSDNGVSHAFTGPTAGGLYTGYAHRFDRLYVYIDAEDPVVEVGPMEDPRGTISLTVLRVDRDVWRDAEERGGLRLVSEPQALLDLAGMGASAWDLTLEVARHYASTLGG